MRATAVAVAVAVCAAAVPARGTPGSTIATVAGSVGAGQVADVGQYPVGVAYAGGRVYLADMLWNAVRRLDPATGHEDVIAGTGNGAFTGADGPARHAGLDAPLSIAAGPDGSLVVGTYHRVLRIGRDGVLRVLAGGGATPAGEGVSGRTAELRRVTGLAVSANGTVYLAQPDTFRVLRLAPDGTLHVVAGNGLSASGAPAPGVAAAYPMRPHGVALDTDGSILIADSENQRVLRVDAVGIVTVVADVPGAAAVAVAADRTVLVAGHDLRAVSRTGALTTLSPTGGLALTAGEGGDVWWVDSTSVYRRHGGVTKKLTGGPGYDRPHGGVPGRLQTWQPLAVATYRGAVYWTDLDTLAWRLADGRARVITSNDEPFFDPMGGPDSHHLVSPEGIAVDTHGVVYVSDPQSSIVYRLTARGRIPVAGDTRICAAWSDRTEVGDGGPATKARLCAPQGLTAAKGKLYVADAGNQRIRVVDAYGRITTLAGTGVSGFSGDGGPASRAQLRYPGDVEVGADGSVYVADTENSVVRRIGRDGIIRTIAGTPGRLGYSGDGGSATTATFWYPTGIAVARDGAVYVADMGNDAIRRIDSRGVVTTLAGGHANAFDGDGGSARAASLGCPGDVALDEAARRLYVADTCNNRIRVIRLG